MTTKTTAEKLKFSGLKPGLAKFAAAIKFATPSKFTAEQVFTEKASPQPQPAPTKPAGAMSQAERTEAGKRFLTAFGAIGGKWFAEGKTFQQAEALFNQQLQKQVTELCAKVAEQDKRHAAEKAALAKQNAVQAQQLGRLGLGKGEMIAP